MPFFVTLISVLPNQYKYGIVIFIERYIYNFSFTSFQFFMKFCFHCFFGVDVTIISILALYTSLLLSPLLLLFHIRLLGNSQLIFPIISSCSSSCLSKVPLLLSVTFNLSSSPIVSLLI